MLHELDKENAGLLDTIEQADKATNKLPMPTEDEIKYIFGLHNSKNNDYHNAYKYRNFDWFMAGLEYYRRWYNNISKHEINMLVEVEKLKKRINDLEALNAIETKVHKITSDKFKEQARALNTHHERLLKIEQKLNINFLENDRSRIT